MHLEIQPLLALRSQDLALDHLRMRLLASSGIARIHILRNYLTILIGVDRVDFAPCHMNNVDSVITIR